MGQEEHDEHVCCSSVSGSENRVHRCIYIPIGSMYAIYGNIYHQYTPNVSICTIHGSYGIYIYKYHNIPLSIHWLLIIIPSSHHKMDKWRPPSVP